MTHNHYEKRTILTVSGNNVTFADPLLYTHYGANSITIPASETGTGAGIDTRASVGHLTRKIKVVAGGPDSNYGYHFINFGYSYNWVDPNNPANVVPRRSVGKFHVEGV